jgi:hypothetical protein
VRVARERVVFLRLKEFRFSLATSSPFIAHQRLLDLLLQLAWQRMRLDHDEIADSFLLVLPAVGY